MTTRTDGRARALLLLLIVLGIGLLIIPFFLTPPAFLDIALRDQVFAANLDGRSVQATEDSSGKMRTVTAQKVDGDVVIAPLGQISSGVGSFTVQVDGYQSATASVDASPMQRVRAVVDLVPTFGRLEVSATDATRIDAVVPATVRAGGGSAANEPQPVTILDLSAGRHRLSAQAAGFCPGDRDVDVVEGKLEKVSLPLSPDLTGNEVARFVLTWGENPRDLDAHVFNQASMEAASLDHVYFRHKEGLMAGRRYASLDVDHTRSKGPETITLYDGADGDFQYLIHLYAGEGTLGGSAGQVEVFTRGCQRKVYAVPRDCGGRIWTVANVRLHDGRVELVDQQRCEGGASPSLGRKRPSGREGS